MARSTSSGPSHTAAPWRIRSLQPRARGSSGEPGTASTSRPCSAASRAVISEPDFSSASTTTTASERPEISRLRRGKSLACARRLGALSETMQPRSAIAA